MKLKKLLDLYDDWNQSISVYKFSTKLKNECREYLFKGDMQEIGFDENGIYKKLKNMEVSHFVFDTEEEALYVKVK